MRDVSGGWVACDSAPVKSPLLGIIPWGIVNNREALINPEVCISVL